MIISKVTPKRGKVSPKKGWTGHFLGEKGRKNILVRGTSACKGRRCGQGGISVRLQCQIRYVWGRGHHGTGLGCEDTDHYPEGIKPLINPLNGVSRKFLRLKRDTSR